MDEKMDKTLIEDAVVYIQDLFRTNAGGHDAEHTMRVYRNTIRIAESEPDCDIQIAALAALLHDADDYKLFNTTNNANARSFLEAHRVPQETIDRICKVINSVSFKQNKGKAPDTLEGKVVQDADRLDAMGAIGVARTFAYGGEHGKKSCRTRIVWTPWGPLELPELLPTAESTAGPWQTLSGIFMTNFCGLMHS